MNFSDELKSGLNKALNEATWLGVEFDKSEATARLFFQVLTLPEDPAQQVNDHVCLVLFPVVRIAASLRNGPWHDEKIPVEPFELEELPHIVQSFGGLPVYGWDFFDVDEKECESWMNRLSLDYRNPAESLEETHTLNLFQDAEFGDPRILDVLIWFRQFHIEDVKGNVIPTEEFVAGGERWWNALYKGDPRTIGHGIFPFKLF